jgi:predicted metalloprotease
MTFRDRASIDPSQVEDRRGRRMGRTGQVAIGGGGLGLLGLLMALFLGDDRIQRMSRGRVSPESWTHGSSRQRQEAFATGYSTGDPNARR